MKSIISWFARNHVAANLLMLFLILTGVVTSLTIKLEVFPEAALEQVAVKVAYPGASPDEIEESIVSKIEEKISGLSGVKQLKSVINEGYCEITAEVLESWDVKHVLDEVKSEVDAIDTFPDGMESPIIKQTIVRDLVTNAAVYGEASEAVLKKLAEDVRNDIVNLPGVTVAELAAVREQEIHIEISERELRKYNITLGMVANIIGKETLDLPAGKIKTENREILIRTKGRKYTAEDYKDIVIVQKKDGSQVKLKDMSSAIKEGFEDSYYSFTFEGKPAAMIQVYGVADQNALEIADEVKKYVEKRRLTMPEGVSIKIFEDLSDILRSRLNLLFKNMLMGLALVALILGILMSFRLAFWITLGIPVSFMFGITMLPQFDVSINMISLFAFILILGIVVDDAIIIGENIFKKMEEGLKPLEAATKGALEVGIPVIFSVLTTIAAFWPLLMVGGFMGKMLKNIPIVVILVLIGSLVESLLILPSHLGGRSYSRSKKEKLISSRLKQFIDGPYTKLLRFCLNWRYSAMAFAFLLLMTIFGVVSAGMIKFAFFPKVEGDSINCYITMPAGTSKEKTELQAKRLEKMGLEALREIEHENNYGSNNLKYMISLNGIHIGREGQVTNSGGHVSQVWMQLVEGDKRKITGAEITRAWRERAAKELEAKSITFGNELHSGGTAIEIHLSMNDQERLLEAKEALKKKIALYAGTFDIADSLLTGKKEALVSLKPSASNLGISLEELAVQIRNAFYGAEALKFQRDKNEIKVIVKYPENERQSLSNIEEMKIRTSNGREIPFSSIAETQMSDAYLTIERSRQRRIIKVTADVDSEAANANEIRDDLMNNYLPKLEKHFPGLRYTLEGEGKNQEESFNDMVKGLVVALFCIYALLAIPFKSFIQPLAIMAAIPFGVAGAIGGHLLMGYDLSILSVFGMAGLTGVVINDSLVLVDLANRKVREEGLPVYNALLQAAKQRFRAITLTSITTFAGLAPIIIERSLQAQFLIPMAISLGFGVVFATFITLLFIPCGYMALHDATEISKKLFGTNRNQWSP